jgi:uncharacterized protein (DUF1800 family)
MDIDNPTAEKAELSASSTAPQERAFADLARRVLARSTAALGRSAPAIAPSIAAGATFASLTGQAEATPVMPQAATFDPLTVRVVNRVSGSFDLDEYSVAASHATIGSYLNYHFAHGSIFDPAFDNFKNSASTNPQYKMVLDPLLRPRDLLVVGPAWQQRWQETVIIRQILSRKRLLERVMEFWGDHFSVDIFRELVVVPKIFEDRAFRLVCFNTFQDLLINSALSPAMSLYLDNAYNAYQPLLPNSGYNENYAREFFELHTMGPAGGYSEADIQLSAAFWAGHSVDLSPASPAVGEYKWVSTFHDNMHPGGVVLGGPLGTDPERVTISPANNGANSQIQALQLIFGTHSHSKTREYLSKKLARFMLAYDVDSPAASAEILALRTQLEANWATHGGDIKELVRLLISSASLSVTSPSAYRPKLKRPLQFATGLAKAFSATVNSPQSNTSGIAELLNDVRRMGHAPFAWGPPNGYPDSEAAWLGGLMTRWEVAFKMLRSATAGAGGSSPVQFYSPELAITDTTLSILFSGVPLTQYAERMSEILTGGMMTTFEKTQVQNFINQAPMTSIPALVNWLRDGMALAASSPTYQYY